ncbi:DUF4755 domain-containing protein [Acetobacter thailandicus]|uniref:DUF4755 domain-containing protein n=1 Tax=Acetobacter thailandicus TaxID=1502842 RepID=UPI001BACB51A|nr:DUF4755 domain-containing protein [Acetobacter thailandicus]MBS0980825.1 DUF4755 domain-containing protein [Acetobacter thailandicus]
MTKGSIGSAYKFDKNIIQYFFKIFIITFIPICILNFSLNGNIYSLFIYTAIISWFVVIFKKKKMIDKRITVFNEKISKFLQEKFKTKFIYENYFILNNLPCCLAYDGKKIFVMNQGNYAILGWNDIRKWSYEIQGSVVTDIIGGNLGHRVQANLQDAQKNRNLHVNSGFTIQVSDVENPNWFFPTGLSGKNTCDKWMEIFNQINDGKLSIEK